MKPYIMNGDITKLKVDAIVNAANTMLIGGGGVDGAIHKAAGPDLRTECRIVRNKKFPKGLPVGEAIITSGYDLPARYVIHTIGPKYDSSVDQMDLLMRCFRRSLDLAEKKGLKSIAFPAISTGAYGYPMRECATVAKKVFNFYDFKSIKEIILCLFTDKDRQVFSDVFNG